jgi:DNA-binding phage protein
MAVRRNSKAIDFMIIWDKQKKYIEHLLKSLEDPKEAAAYLDACLEDEDPCFSTRTKRCC